LVLKKGKCESCIQRPPEPIDYSELPPLEDIDYTESPALAS
jgi:hypothetical protein